MARRWKLKQERAAIEAEMKSLREYRNERTGQMKAANEAYREAIINGNSAEAAKQKELIDSYEREIKEINENLNSDVNSLNKHSHTQYQDGEKHSHGWQTLLTGVGIAAGTGLTYVGVKSAYDADTTGSLVNKGVLGMVKNFLGPFGVLKKH